MDNLIIRPLEQTDAKDMWENIYTRNTLNEVEERVADSIKKFQLGVQVQFVAEVDKRIVGTMIIKKDQHSLYLHIGELEDVVVNPMFQRMGIAKKLFDECKKYSRENDLLMIKLNCRGGTVAETVYKKIGFIEAGRIPNGIIEPWGDKRYFDDVILYYNLG